MIITDVPDSHYEVVAVGTGFGSMFFVHRLLQLRPATKILMIERGSFRPWEMQVSEGHNSPIASHDTFMATGARKQWVLIPRRS